MKAAARYAIGILVIFVSGHLTAQDTAAQRHEMPANQFKRIAAEMTTQSWTIFDRWTIGSNSSLS